MTVKRRMTEEFTLRMLGDNITLARYQWEDLLYELRDDSEMAQRIRAMLAEDSAPFVAGEC